MSRKRNMINCKICGHTVEKLFVAKVLNKYNVEYFYCLNCGFIQTEEPYWLKEAYLNPVSHADTGVLSRTLNLGKKLTVILFFLFSKNAKQYNYLDYGGGYGLLVRLMRDIGFNFYWFEKYTQNLFAKGFEYRGGSIKAITAFEVFEHLLDPKEAMSYCSKEVKCNTIIFSTLLYGEEPPNPENWWYYAFQTGQHISFYNLKTLKYLAEKHNLNLLTNEENIHVLTSIKRSNSVFKFLITFSSYLFFAVRKTLKSKTFEDYKVISKYMNRNPIREY